MTNPPVCFILAAGLGKRMRPMTDHIPKPLLPIAGKPLLESIIEKVISAGVGRIGINTYHLNERIEEWVQGSDFSDKISLYREATILDTGGALKNAEVFLAGSNFIVHNGDILSDIDLSVLLEYHSVSGNIATLAVLDYPAFNNVIIDQSGFLKGIGKTCRSADDAKIVAFTGIAVYSADLLKFIPSGSSSVIDAWIKAIGAGFQIGTFDSSGCGWSDIGSPAAYVSAVVQKLRSEGETVYIDRSTEACGDIEIDGHIIIEKGCSLGRASSLRNCIVLPGGSTKAATHYENSIIGNDYAIAIDEDTFGLPVAGKGTLIGIGGSDRKYFRINEQDRPVVLMECGHEDPDFFRHIEYTVFFKKYGMPVPEMYGADFENRLAYFEDLGDISLYSWLKCPRCDDEIELVYSKVLEILVRLHCSVSDHVSDCPTLATRVFDYDHLRWETSYFMERFVRGLKNIQVADQASLDDEFHFLALKADTFRKRIIHRDFQSQNIMMTKGSVPRIIDYQGARLAPPAYDVASLLWDPYSPLKEGLRARLLAFYMSLLSDRAGPWFATKEFYESLLYCRLQRHMQALGAYGYLSNMKGKTYFLKHVSEALRLLKVEAGLAREEFPFLYDLVNRL